MTETRADVPELPGGREEAGGESACQLDRVCEHCGALPDGPAPPVCERCGTARTR